MYLGPADGKQNGNQDSDIDFCVSILLLDLMRSLEYESTKTA